MKLKNPRLELDGPWKVIFDLYCQELILILFPAIYEQVDWAFGFQALDSELQKIARGFKRGKLLLDKVFQVRLKTGDSTAILIHSEMQNQKVDNFGEIMFWYNIRLREWKKMPVVSVAVLGDLDPAWKPSSYCMNTLNCQVQFQFPVCKLIELNENELEQSKHPVSFLILAHLAAQRTVNSPGDRMAYKKRLIQNLRKFDLDKKQIGRIFMLLDWILQLPEELEDQLVWEVKQEDTGNDMVKEKTLEQMFFDKWSPIMEKQWRTEGRQVGIQEGRQVGIQEGILQTAREAVLEILEARFGKIPDSLRNRICHLDDSTQLKSLLRDAARATSMGEFKVSLKG